MALKSIDIRAENIDQAVTLLDKGFPAHGIAFWRSMLTRIKQMHKRQSVSSHGELLLNDEEPVGVLLKIQHRAPNISKPIVNLSSWYVEPDFRWYAPRMLLKATADKEAIYTDLSPSPEVFNLNEKLGFKTVSSGQLLFPLPLTSLIPSGNCKVVSATKIDASELHSELHHFIMSHHADRSESLIFNEGGELHPAIFQLRKRRGLLTANLIYSDNLIALQRNSAAIARHLLGKGIMFMTMPAIETTRPKGSFRLKSFKPQQVKGDWQANIVDQTYSEAILLPYQI